MQQLKSRNQVYKYLKEKGRSLPVHECLVESVLHETGIANFMISRRMPSGNFLIALFLVDMYCLGVKNVMYNVNLTPEEYEEFREKLENSSEKGFKQKDVHEFHNLIYGALDFAEEYGFKPHKDFAIAEYILDPDQITDEIDHIEFGIDGLPTYFQGPNDSPTDVKRIINTLEKTAGKGNYHFTQFF